MHTQFSPNGKGGAPNRRTVAYCRVSTQEQATEGFSLPDQERACRLYASMKVAAGSPGWSEIEEGDVFGDPGVSGTLAERPALARLLAAARAGRISHVVVSKMDRLARSLKVLLDIWDELEACGVGVVVIEYGIDTSTAVGRLIRNVLASIAEFERDSIATRCATGRAESHRAGGVVRPEVYGYRYLPPDRAQGLRPRLEIDPLQAAVVRRIFGDLAAGGSLNALAAQLNAEGAPTLHGNGHGNPKRTTKAEWYPGTLRKMVNNPLYAGQAGYGRQRITKGPGGKRAASVPGDPGQVIYTQVPAIVGPELAAAAQAQISRNRVQAKRNTTGEYLLGGGLLRCGALLADGTPCGTTMHAEAGGPGRRDHYRCCHREPQGYRRHSVLAADADAAAWRAIRRALTETSTLLDDLRAAQDTAFALAEQADQDIRTCKSALAEVERRRDTLLDLHLSRRLDQERWAKRDAKLLAEQQRLLDEHAALSTRRSAALAQQLPLAEVAELCTRLSNRLDTLGFEQRQHVLRLLVSGACVDQKKLTLDGAFDSVALVAYLDGHDGGTVDTTINGRISNTPIPFRLNTPLALATAQRGSSAQEQGSPTRRHP